MEVALCTVRTPELTVRVCAELEAGRLTVSGRDSGRLCRRIWGEFEYGYAYRFDAENTRRLAGLLGAPEGDEPLARALAERFCGEGICCELVEFCNKNGVEYVFYAG